MGTFADLRCVDGSWVSNAQQGRHVLSIEIHDSDIATIAFSPAHGANGLFYLGIEPATYFEDPRASSPVDKDAEARAFARWAADATRHKIDPVAVQALMAPSDFDPERDEVDDFVEDAVEKFLTLIGLQMPDLNEAHRALMHPAPGTRNATDEVIKGQGLDPETVAREFRAQIAGLVAPRPRRWLRWNK